METVKNLIDEFITIRLIAKGGFFFTFVFLLYAIFTLFTYVGTKLVKLLFNMFPLRNSI